MKVKISIKHRINFGIQRIQTALYLLLLKPLGLLNWLFRGVSITNSQAGTSMSPDGCYLISCSWEGLIYLLDIGFVGPPLVIGFVITPKPWGAHFSKDMQQIIITHGAGSTTILSAVPAEGFSRRQFPILQDWISDVPHVPPRNIFEFILHTSSAYWKYVYEPKENGGRLDWPFTPPPPTEPDFNWGQWVTKGERYLDLPRNICEREG